MTVDQTLAPPPPHVLVLDDEREIADLLREILEDEGYRVSTAYAVPRMERVKALRPDLIVSDLVFGRREEAGRFLVDWQRDPDLPRVPVLLCTASASPLRTLDADLKERRFAVVAKPFDIDGLLGEVARCLRGPLDAPEARGA